MAAVAMLSTNQQNAQHSTGPRTQAGKERVRLNAFKHGVYAKLLVLPGDDQLQFEARRNSLIEHYQPETELETALIQELNETEWRVSRLVALETNLLSVGTSENLEKVEDQFGPVDEIAAHAIAQAIAYRENARLFAQIGRHEARLERARVRITAQLAAIITLRQAEAAPPNPAVERQPGFVPPISTPAMPHFTGPLADIKRKQWIRQQATRNAVK